jgi:hypothetical protein
MPLETFRSRVTIGAIYFDGSLKSALEVAQHFPGQLQIEFTGDEDFLVYAKQQANFLRPHVWVYNNGSSRVEWRDHEELTKQWEPESEGAKSQDLVETNLRRQRKKK